MASLRMTNLREAFLFFIWDCGQVTSVLNPRLDSLTSPPTLTAPDSDFLQHCAQPLVGIGWTNRVLRRVKRNTQWSDTFCREICQWQTSFCQTIPIDVILNNLWHSISEIISRQCNPKIQILHQFHLLETKWYGWVGRCLFYQPSTKVSWPPPSLRGPSKTTFWWTTSKIWKPLKLWHKSSGYCSIQYSRVDLKFLF